MSFNQKIEFASVLVLRSLKDVFHHIHLVRRAIVAIIESDPSTIAALRGVPGKFQTDRCGDIEYTSGSGPPN